MPPQTPNRLVLHYEAGRSREVSFADLPSTLQCDLLAQPFASRPSPTPQNEKFVLVEWEDGWKEVIEVDPACTEINRFYVISRVEEVGRLSLKKADGYPELVEIARRPLGIKSISFGETFRPESARVVREGKKTEHFFSLRANGSALQQAAADFERALQAEGIDRNALASGEPEACRHESEAIRLRMGLTAGRRHQDLLDFLAHLARTPPNTSERSAR